MRLEIIGYPHGKSTVDSHTVYHSGPSMWITRRTYAVCISPGGARCAVRAGEASDHRPRVRVGHPELLRATLDAGKLATFK